jgi:hypothetical protein
MGVPVVSTFDPDGVIAKYGLGWIASSIGDLVCAIRESINEPKKWQTASTFASDYCVRIHALDVCMEQFVCFFKKLLPYVTADKG